MLKCYTGCSRAAILNSLGLNTSTASRPKRSLRPVREFDTVDEVLKSYNPKPPDGVWEYRLAGGQTAFVVARWNTPDGKVIRPAALIKHKWVAGGFPAPLPLYGLPELLANPAEAVHVCEGEKLADAARDLGLLATTSAHGSESAKKTDWSPLAGRKVVILPDNDPPGTSYAESVVSLLSALTPLPTVSIVTIPDLPVGGDVVDFIDAYGDLGDARHILDGLVAATPPLNLLMLGDGPLPKLVRMSDVEPRQVEWVWRNRLARGKLTLLVGDPGLGKSFITLDIASRISKGSKWPDCDESSPRGDVILMLAEDDLADTIRPRLDAAGADTTRIIALRGVTRRHGERNKHVETPFCLKSDIDVLEKTLRQNADTKLIVIDPISSYLGDTDSHNNAEIRAVLSPLVDLAMKYNVAVLAVSHLNKNSGGPAIYRSMGSLAFTAVARCALLVAKDNKDPRRRLLLPIKNNIAPDAYGSAYTIEDQGSGAFVKWDDQKVTITAEEAIGTH
jgi:hypothetical protein